MLDHGENLHAALNSTMKDSNFWFLNLFAPLEKESRALRPKDRPAQRAQHLYPAPPQHSAPQPKRQRTNLQAQRSYQTPQSSWRAVVCLCRGAWFRPGVHRRGRSGLLAVCTGVARCLGRVQRPVLCGAARWR